MARRARSMKLSPCSRSQCLSTSVSGIFPLERALAIDVTPGSLLRFSPSLPPPPPGLLFLHPLLHSLHLCPFFVCYNRAEGTKRESGDLFSQQLGTRMFSMREHIYELASLSLSSSSLIYRPCFAFLPFHPTLPLSSSTYTFPSLTSPYTFVSIPVSLVRRHCTWMYTVRG